MVSSDHNKKQIAVNLLTYMQRKLSLEELVSWAEDAFMEGDMQDEDAEVVRDILAQFGLADVKEFGLYWEDCDSMMRKHSVKSVLFLGGKYPTIKVSPKCSDNFDSFKRRYCYNSGFAA